MVDRSYISPTARQSAWAVDLGRRVITQSGPRKSKRKGSRTQKRRGATRNNGIAKTISRLPAGFADGADVVMKFSDSYIVAQGATGGTASSLVFSMNSLFQCNVTASAGQPQYYSQYSAVYQKYVVTHSRIRWRLRQVNGGASVAGVSQGHIAALAALPAAVLYPGPSGASTATSVRSAAAQQYSKRHEFNVEEAAAADGTHQTQQSNARVEWVGSHSMGISKIEAEPVLRTAAYEALVGANPSRQPTWTFIFQDVLADTAFEGVFLMEVDIYYTTKFFDRVLISDSSYQTKKLKAAPVLPIGLWEEKKVSSPDSEPVSRPLSLDEDLVLVKRSDLPQTVMPAARPATLRSVSLK